MKTVWRRQKIPALPETDGNVLEDETTADEASSAETEADIEKETENTETNDKNSAEDAGASEKQTRAMGLRMSLRAGSGNCGKRRGRSCAG